jgi:hypothetical protein
MMWKEASIQTILSLQTFVDTGEITHPPCFLKLNNNFQFENKITDDIVASIHCILQYSFCECKLWR